MMSTAFLLMYDGRPHVRHQMPDECFRDIRGSMGIVKSFLFFFLLPHKQSSLNSLVGKFVKGVSLAVGDEAGVVERFLQY